MTECGQEEDEKSWQNGAGFLLLGEEIVERELARVRARDERRQLPVVPSGDIHRITMKQVNEKQEWKGRGAPTRWRAISRDGFALDLAHSFEHLVKSFLHVASHFQPIPKKKYSDVATGT